MTSAEQAKHNRRAMFYSIPKKVTSFAKTKTGTVVLAAIVAAIMIIGQAHQRAKVDAHDAKYNIAIPGVTFR